MQRFGNDYIFDIQNGMITCDQVVVAQYEEKPNDKYIEEMNYFMNNVYKRLGCVNDLEMANNVLKIALT